MAKASKVESLEQREEAFEIIELALDDIETLTKAFNMISRVCEELNNPFVEIVDELPDSLIN